jgi:hypothetical protein
LTRYLAMWTATAEVHDLRQRNVPEHEHLVDEVLLLGDPAPHPFQGAPKEVAFPFRGPQHLEVRAVRIDLVTGLRRTGRVRLVGRSNDAFPSGLFPVPVDEPAPDDRQQPGAEAALGPVVAEGRHLLGDRDHGVLHNLLGLRLAELRLDADGVDQAPVGLEEFAPTVLVLMVLQPEQQALTRRVQR